MAQAPLSFQYQGTQNGNFTALGGLPIFTEMVHACGLLESISDGLHTKSQGWTDVQIIHALLLVNFAGGECVEDIKKLEADPGMRKLFLDNECCGMRRKERRAYLSRFRKSKNRAFPAQSVLRRYLEQFHNAPEEERRIEGEAFIPASNDNLNALQGFNKVLIEYAQLHNPVDTATLDEDATLVATNKRTAKFCYKKFKAYQPFNTYWAEQRLLLHSEFRDGNVNAGFGQKRLLEESLDLLPKSVKKVLLRSDTAGYEEGLIRYCSEAQNKRFGIIEFAISVKVTDAFRKEVFKAEEENWHPIYKYDKDGNSFKTDQEWAEVSYVPSWVKSKKTPDYRFIAIREKLSPQQVLPGIEPVQKELPFPTMTMKQSEYKLFGIITNRTIPANDLINWHRERCGHSEKVHSIEKTDFAGGQLPSEKFGANAAWWHIMILAFNIHALMQKLVLPKSLQSKRMKGLRFHLINIAGCVVSHARRLIIKVNDDPNVIGLLLSIRKRIAALANPPPEMPIAVQ